MLQVYVELLTKLEYVKQYSNRIVVGNEGLERPRGMWADGYGIKMDGKETGCDHVS